MHPTDSIVSPSQSLPLNSPKHDQCFPFEPFVSCTNWGFPELGGTIQTWVPSMAMETPNSRWLQVAGGQDLERAAESPLLTGRVVAQLAAEAGFGDGKRGTV